MQNLMLLACNGIGWEEASTSESACSVAKRKLQVTISAFDPLYASTSIISPSPPRLSLSTLSSPSIQSSPHAMSIRASSSGNTPMGPPADRDVVMAPPQFNPQQYPPPPNQQAGVQQKPPQDYVEKYKRLKRKYFELEDVSVVRNCGPPASTPPFSHIRLHLAMMCAFYRNSRKQSRSYCDLASAHPL